MTMATVHLLGIASTAFLAVLLLHTTKSEDNSRLELLKFGDEESNTNSAIAFHVLKGKCRWASIQMSPNRNAAKPKVSSVKPSTSWNDLPAPAGQQIYSNPSSARTKNVESMVFVQTVNGQVYGISAKASTSPQFGSWLLIGSKLPFDLGATLHGRDTVKAIYFDGKPYVVSRSITNSSKAYWSSQESNGKWSAWNLVGGNSVSLLTDVSVVYNNFSKYLEAFTIMTDGYLYRTWQTGFSKWHSWDKTGYSAPKSTHAPVAHSMDTNVFNGRLNVFLHGNDDYIHHIWQTTCDKVANPWGWCTWSTWNTIGGKIPNTKAVANTLAVGNNVHLGIELFSIGAKGKLYYMYQTQRHATWQNWQVVSGGDSSVMVNLPSVNDDSTGWWTAFGLDEADSVVILQQKRSFLVSPSEVGYGAPVKVTWSVPSDEATHMDWIGVYPRGAGNKQYLDYSYVGGSQNPYKDAKPSGSLTLESYLPEGQYDYRYLVNKRYVSAVGSSLTVTKGSKDKEWIQVFRGIFNGLQIKNLSVVACVKEAEQMVSTFKQSFAAFEDREIYKGMHLLGFALGDVIKGLETCKVTSSMIHGVEAFVKDLKKCIEGSCEAFAIDAIKEIVILYENIYEIYGDVQGASNSFKSNAFEQGGLCVGRVVHACVNLR